VRTWSNPIADFSLVVEQTMTAGSEGNMLAAIVSRNALTNATVTPYFWLL